MGKAQREKGARAERDAALEWQAAGFPRARRRCSGEEAQDRNPGRDLDGTPGFAVQVKNDRSATPHQALAEARAAARPGEIPVGWFRKDRHEFVAVIATSDFFRLLQAAQLIPKIDTQLTLERPPGEP